MVTYVGPNKVMVVARVAGGITQEQRSLSVAVPRSVRRTHGGGGRVACSSSSFLSTNSFSGLASASLSTNPCSLPPGGPPIENGDDGGATVGSGGPAVIVL